MDPPPPWRLVHPEVAQPAERALRTGGRPRGAQPLRCSSARLPLGALPSTRAERLRPLPSCPRGGRCAGPAKELPQAARQAAHRVAVVVLQHVHAPVGEHLGVQALVAPGRGVALARDVACCRVHAEAQAQAVDVVAQPFHVRELAGHRHEARCAAAGVRRQAGSLPGLGVGFPPVPRHARFAAASALAAGLRGTLSHEGEGAWGAAHSRLRASPSSSHRCSRICSPRPQARWTPWLATPA